MRNREMQRKVRRGEIPHPKTQALEEPISYFNSEAYPDPTAFFAVQRIVKKQAAEQSRKEPRKRPRTLVARYY